MTRFICLILFGLMPHFLLAQGSSRGGIVADSPVVNRAGKRTALVIGNAAYQHHDILRNPLNDAHAMREVLQKAGFDVVEKTNLTKAEFDKVIEEWGKTLGRYEVALFYYAGHGMGINGKNLLLPIDANPQSQTQADDHACSADRVLSLMETNQVKSKILLLDACRNNPFTRSGGANKSGGFVEMSAQAGTFIGFAAGLGKTASDGDRSHGLYTEAILSHFLTPGKKFVEIFTEDIAT